MNKNDTRIGLGLIAATAICCGSHLLLLGVGLPILALATGQPLLIAAAIAAGLAIVGIVLWRRRSGARATETCTTRVVEPSIHSPAIEAAQLEAPAEREPIGAGKEGQR